MPGLPARSEEGSEKQEEDLCSSKHSKREESSLIPLALLGSP